MKTLDNCRWVPNWVSHLGCLKGCLDYVGLEVTSAWLYGGTGHAFVINMHEEVCPSGPTAWKTTKLFELGRNLGYDVDGVHGSKYGDDFHKLQSAAWDHIRQAIDTDLPCYGWELEIPEYYVVYGYDDTGYHFSGPLCDEGKGPKPWQEVADTGIGVLEMYSVKPGKATEDALIVKQAFSFALEHATNPDQWIFEDYRSGIAGYDNWIQALKRGVASDLGMRYNIAVWLECRKYAEGFLKEARERLNGIADDLFDEAREAYMQVTIGLEEIAEIYPWKPDATAKAVVPIDDACHTALAALESAREAEVRGLQLLEKLVEVL
jgi:hypothetical protein